MTDHRPNPRITCKNSSLGKFVELDGRPVLLVAPRPAAEKSRAPRRYPNDAVESRKFLVLATAC